jgi:hypothetical protein
MDIILRKRPQLSKTGTFGDDGWKQMSLDKVDFINEIFNDDSDSFILSDVDIIFFKPIKEIILEYLKYNDICFQADGDTRCTGFFACNKTLTTKQLFLDVKEMLINNIQPTGNLEDQWIANYLLNTTHKDIKTVLLPDTFYNYGFNTRIPKDAYLYHANFIIGIDNKLAAIQRVLKEIENVS